MLDREELNALLGDPKAHGSLFRTQKSNGEGGKLLEPAFPQFKALAFKEHFEGATVRLVLGLNDTEVELEDCKIRRVTLEPQVGGMTVLACMLRAVPTGQQVATLFAFMNHDGAVEIADAKRAEKAKKQSDLPLNTFGEGEQSDAQH
jgi:hypothetical protein